MRSLSFLILAKSRCPFQQLRDRPDVIRQPGRHRALAEQAGGADATLAEGLAGVVLRAIEAAASRLELGGA